MAPEVLVKRFVLALLLLSSPALAKEITVDELRTIQGKLKAMDNLSVDFVQSSFKTMRKKTTKREGKAVFAKTGKFKWMLETPTKEYKIYDGKDFYDYDPASKTAAKYSPTGPRSYELRQIVDLVLNFDTLLKRYDLKKAEQEGDLVKIVIAPKTDTEIATVDLHLDAKEGFITFLKLNMKGGNNLAHDFKAPSTKELPADTFVLPKGVKVTESL